LESADFASPRPISSRDGAFIRACIALAKKILVQADGNGGSMCRDSGVKSEMSVEQSRLGDVRFESKGVVGTKEGLTENRDGK